MEELCTFLNKLVYTSSTIALYQVWLKLTQGILTRSLKCEKFTDRRTQAGQLVVRKVHMSFQTVEMGRCLSHKSKIIYLSSMDPSAVLLLHRVH